MKPFRTIPETIALFKRRCGECEQQAAQAKNQIEFAKYSTMANTYWKAAQELQYNTKEGWRGGAADGTLHNGTMESGQDF